MTQDGQHRRPTRPSEPGSSPAVAAVIAGHADYDTLTPDEQAVVRAAWAAAITQGPAGLNIAWEKAAAGKPYSELDEQGVAVTRHPRDPGFLNEPGAPR